MVREEKQIEFTCTFYRVCFLATQAWQIWKGLGHRVQCIWMPANNFALARKNKRVQFHCTVDQLQAQ